IGSVEPKWEALDDGAWLQTARLENELSYAITLTPYDDVIDIHVKLTNESDRTWANSLAFNCFNVGGPSVRDHECVRHWCRVGGEFKRLVEVPRKFSRRATIQLYSVEGQPPGSEIPFVHNFRATPEELDLEGWLAVVSRDGTRLVATASKPTLFLFQNMEYSCIHAAPSLGRLEPGETGEAINRIYFVEASLAEWHLRMLTDWF
ncbi:MAG TPA: hypothetical protein QGH10_10925, partial [Armatimonadota bacterium]|nr:hypothetical protein [Armatimonadota bacterium]